MADGDAATATAMADGDGGTRRIDGAKKPKKAYKRGQYGDGDGT
jgi:hypothetical protein